MRIALISPGYPSEEKPYNYAFVHARARLYGDRGQEVGAFALGEDATYTLDGIPVSTGRRATLQRALRDFHPEVLALHAPNFRTIPVARSIDRPMVSWIHGHEAMISLRSVSFGRTRRERAMKWVKLVPRLSLQLGTVRRFLPTQHRVVFVSRWMQEVAERHTLRRYSNAEVIPNPVDTDLFAYRLDAARRTRGVTTRSLNSTKYGIDLAIRAFAGLEEASLDIYGQGAMAAEFQALLRSTGANASLITRGHPHREMPELFSRYGFFVAPSRVEAQGVAMCEAMACGLPVVATRVGGIPEFVDDGVEGFLVQPESPEAIAAGVRKLVSDPARYLEMSRAARLRMERQCSQEVVATRELGLLESAARG
ncbi:MAG: glycosyltransferase family 4 protein [Deltaproteobacteria bacterium]|nr:glycosyltransferase family 4 protein [Deltaproteobacteria bacterium]